MDELQLVGNVQQGLFNYDKTVADIKHNPVWGGFCLILKEGGYYLRKISADAKRASFDDLVAFGVKESVAAQICHFIHEKRYFESVKLQQLVDTLLASGKFGLESDRAQWTKVLFFELYILENMEF